MNKSDFNLHSYPSNPRNGLGRKVGGRVRVIWEHCHQPEKLCLKLSRFVHFLETELARSKSQQENNTSYIYRLKNFYCVTRLLVWGQVTQPRKSFLADLCMCSLTTRVLYANVAEGMENLQSLFAKL